MENIQNPAIHFLVEHENGRKTRFSHDLIHQTKESIEEFGNALIELNKRDPSVTAWFTMGKFGNTENEL